MNLTCVNALAFVGGIGLAAAMQSLNTPPDGGTMAEEAKMQLAVCARNEASLLSVARTG